MTIEELLQDVERIGWDTAPIIYFVEANSAYDMLVTPIFQSISRGQVYGVTSTITLAEVLIHPIRQGNTELAAQYRNLLSQSANFRLVPIDEAVAERAAILRSTYNLRLPDALQIAAAVYLGCDAFLTNDKQLKKVSDIQVVLLDELTLPEN